MPQIINTNIASLNAQRNLNRTQGALEISLQRLSSGLRINSAKDDAAGLAISERFTTQIRGLNQAIRNANDGISFAQVAEGALSTVGDSLQRIREIAVQAINDTNSPADRQALNNEVQQLLAEVNRVASSTQFNGQNILDGSLGDLTFQVGANQGQIVTATGVDARGSRLGADTETGEYVLGNELGAIAADDLTINGESVILSDAITSEDVDDVIAAINAVANDSDVTAQKSTELEFVLTYDGAQVGPVIINGVSIDVPNPTSIDAFVDEVNDKSGATGVTASVTTGTGTNAGTITFESANAADVEITDNGIFTDTFLAATTTFQAGVVLVADVGGTISVGGTAATVAAVGLDSPTFENNILNDVDVLTGETANDALRTIDYALQQVSGFRSELGAVQIRFEATIANLEVQAENTSAARSRILDADFAAETAALTRATILQQAGISVLAQANALPQQVLALLQ